MPPRRFVNSVNFAWSPIVGHLTAATSGPYAQVTEAFSLCMFLFRTFYQTLPSGPPCSEQQGHRLQAHHKIQCLWIPVTE